MTYENKLDLLKQIKKVDAPHFLLISIKQQIQHLGNAEAPVKWKWAFALTSVIVVAINVFILFESSSADAKRAAGIQSVVNGMGLSSKTDLYNE
jgi:hypothetical protein